MRISTETSGQTGGGGPGRGRGDARSLHVPDPAERSGDPSAARFEPAFEAGPAPVIVGAAARTGSADDLLTGPGTLVDVLADAADPVDPAPAIPVEAADPAPAAADEPPAGPEPAALGLPLVDPALLPDADLPAAPPAPAAPDSAVGQVSRIRGAQRARWALGAGGQSARSAIRSGLSRAGQSLNSAGQAMTGGEGDKAPAAALVRVDRRTKDLTKRLRPGEIAVIDHEDIDRVAADALIACRPAAVVNAAHSISGRYPNLGPEIIVSAGIPLIDNVGAHVMDLVREGESLRVDGNVLFRGETPLVAGKLLDTADVIAAMEEARAGLSSQLEAFVENTMEYLRKERDLLLDGIGVPDVRTDFDDKHVLIVVRGYHYREDLKVLRPYIREYRPLLIGVDGGADAIIEAGYKPSMIVGDMDSVSDAALTSGAELVVHAYRDGRAPGLDRIRALERDCVVFPATGTSEDIAMLLADDKGAKLIVAVGSHYNLVEFLDKGRAGMSSTFVTRLRVGGKLVDAKGVSRLYRSQISSTSLLLLVGAAFITMLGAAYVSPLSGLYWDVLRSYWDSFVFWVQGLFS
ncbi:MAG TPA: putative cytokinetic ring protein SteA [Actinocrinis sp.]|nr:putative cytokinetic ring protein SteA [Actinocrinis sp.]